MHTREDFPHLTDAQYKRMSRAPKPPGRPAKECKDGQLQQAFNQLLAENGLTYVSFAGLLMVNRTTVYRWMTTTNPPFWALLILKQRMELRKLQSNPQL